MLHYLATLAYTVAMSFLLIVDNVTLSLDES